MKNFLHIALSALLLLALPVSSFALFGKSDPDKERKDLQESRTEALQALYADKPATRQELKESKGYAVFSSMGINILLISTERGGGILHDNKTGKDTYMKMFSAGGGIGMGVKNFSLIFVFHTASAMENFQKEGWDFAGKADASADSGDEGGSAGAGATVVPGTTIYQMTDEGLALQATLQGTKFWADEDLN